MDGMGRNLSAVKTFNCGEEQGQFAGLGGWTMRWRVLPSTADIHGSDVGTDHDTKSKNAIKIMKLLSSGGFDIADMSICFCHAVKDLTLLLEYSSSSLPSERYQILLNQRPLIKVLICTTISVKHPTFHHRESLKLSPSSILFIFDTAELFHKYSLTVLSAVQKFSLVTALTY
jgi:hypothetical protein